MADCKEGKCCNKNNCRFWIDFPEDDNCCLISIEKNPDGLTLEEIGERLKVSHVYVSKVEAVAIDKFKKRLKKDTF